MEVDRQRYYSTLVENDENKGYPLMRAYANKMEEVRSGILVCKNVPRLLKWVGIGQSADTGKEDRSFTLFRSHLDVYNHMMGVPVVKRSFFEIIQGNKPQKPHFDIDIEAKNGVMPDSRVIMSEILNAMLDTLYQEGVLIDMNKDVLIYCSSRPGKESYHVVVNGWMHNDNKDAKNFAKQVKSRLSSYASDYVDMSVYKPNQQFRLLHCSKLRIDNMKKPVPQWNTGKYIITYPPVKNMYDEFAYSMVGVVFGCNMLPPFSDPEDVQHEEFELGTDGKLRPVPKRTYDEREVVLTKEHIDKCMDELYRLTGEPDIFTVRCTDKSLISLTKKRPYLCPICNRRHENENPFITVSPKGRAKYYCRRAESAIDLTWLYGVVKEDEVDEEIDDDDVSAGNVARSLSNFYSKTTKTTVIKEETYTMTPSMLSGIKFDSCKIPVMTKTTTTTKSTRKKKEKSVESYNLNSYSNKLIFPPEFE